MVASRIVPATLAFNSEGTPISPAFDDIYHSVLGDRGPWGQAEEVFVGGNDLLGEHARWRGRQHFAILETGFGLGLNFVATANAWLRDAGRGEFLHYVAVEKHPFLREDLRILWDRLAPEKFARTLADALVEQWPLPVPGLHRLTFAEHRIRLTLAFGEAENLLPKLSMRADAIYLDGFAPRRNPELWSPRIFASIAKLANSDATVASWSAASNVREGLAAVGFEITRSHGFAGKRHRIFGRFRGFVRPPASAPEDRHAIVIGAGLAGCGVTQALAERGWRITLIDRQTELAAEASGNLAGAFHPIMSRDDNHLARLTRHAFLNNLQSWREIARHHPFAWAITGGLQLPGTRRRGEGLPPVSDWPTELVRSVDAAEARTLTGIDVREGGLWFPEAGWLHPASLCAAQLARCSTAVTRIFATEIARVHRIDTGWEAIDASGRCLAQAPVLVHANALDALRLLPDQHMPLRAVRGQLTHLPASTLAGPKACLFGNGYLIPETQGQIIVGATYGPDDMDTAVRESDHADNLRRLTDLINMKELPVSVQSLFGRASLRAVTPDRLPLIGALPEPGGRNQPPSRAKRLPGAYCALGFASRGILWGTLAGAVIAAQIEGEPSPLERDLLTAMDPARFGSI